MRKKRILWICNHVTLMDAEVPLLIELGFEVYVPKKFPVGIEFVSCVSKTDYDPSLTISSEDIALLNSVNFYDDVFGKDVIDAINRNFDIAFVTFYEKPIRLLVNHFSGIIFIRAFGLAKDASYWEVAQETWGQHLLDQMQAIRDRLYFAMSYRNLEKVEKNIFRENAVFLPLGLPENFAGQLRNKYNGAKRQILFVCPKICAVEYYYQAYKSFKHHFWGFPYVIAGRPFGKITDRHLLGYLPREDFNRVFCESRVMYYHSVEPRHLHYHPLEAIYANQPLIFMSQGMLGQLTPKVKYPGAADTMTEAKIKVFRILANDRPFIREVQQSQQELLKFFSHDYVKKYWVKYFLPLVKDLDEEKKHFSPVVPVESEHIGLILPIAYRGGTLHAFIQIAKMLRACGYRVTIGLPKEYLIDPGSEFYFPTVLEDVRRRLGEYNDIPIRFFEWDQPTQVQYDTVCKMGHLPQDKKHLTPFCVMNDHINCFCECDRWLFVSDRLYKGTPIPLRPFSVVVYDYLQRYLPFQLLPESLENYFINAVRFADGVFVTNQETAKDMILHIGVPHKKIFLLPFEFTAKEMEKYTAHNRPPCQKKRPYVVWACNRGWHKNHVKVLNALIRYYREENGELEVFITGVDTNILDYKKARKEEKNRAYDDTLQSKKKTPAHVIEFRELFKKNKDVLKNNVHVEGEIDRYTYFDLIAGADFLFLSSLCDNGAFASVEAAWLGTPCASSDYPHMRQMAGYFGIEPLWYKGEETDSIIGAFKRMQRESADYRKRLPSHEFLASLSYERQKDIIQKQLREAWL